MKRFLVPLLVLVILAAMAVVAMPQQNVEPALRSLTAKQRADVKLMVQKTVEDNWLVAADETMNAIEATQKLTPEDRAELTKREQGKSGYYLFLLRLQVLQQLASK